MAENRWKDVYAVSDGGRLIPMPSEAQQQHDERLKFDCLREALSDLRCAERQPYAMRGGYSPPENRINSPAVLTLAREIYREITGREWPV